ncbi:MAG: polysaccharide deacetylase family protein [Pseudomonadota bacterium]
MASVSLDLDNHWAYLKARGDEHWRDYPSYLEVAAPRITAFFNQLAIKPTIFVVGKDLDLDNGISAVTLFHQAGFEIGNHSENHRADFHGLEPAEIAADIRECESKILKLTGARPIGFRGPSFQISDHIAAILIERQYIYDASSYPTSIGPLARAYHFFNAKLSAAERDKQKHLFGGFSNAFSRLDSYEWQVNGSSITEVPVTTMPLLRLPIHFTYLNYLADKSVQLAKFYFNVACRLLRLTNTQPSLLLHATDFLGTSDELVPDFLPGMKRDYTEKLAFLEYVFRHLSQYYKFSGIAESLRK